MNTMDLQTLKLDVINPAAYNPRTIDKDEFAGLVTSLKTFGQQENLIVNKDMTLISGHQRLEAMKSLGYTEAICNVVDLDKHQEKKLNLTMNNQAISGKWDDIKLAEILEELKLDDDYGSLRLDKLEPLDLSGNVDQDEPPDVSSEPGISELGVVYQLGRHKLMCGDSTDFGQVSELMNGIQADMVFTDPPYGVDYEGKTKDRLKIDNDKNTRTWAEVLPNYIANTKAGAAFYVCCPAGNNFKDFLLPFEEHCYQSSTIIWVKNSLVMGHGDYHYQHEPILYGWNKEGTHQYYGDRTQTTVWNIDRPTSSKEHPTMKPLALIAKAIQNSSKSGDIVLDLFGGSGSTLMACDQLSRTCFMMEVDPRYADVIRKRYARSIGKEDEWETITPALQS